MKNLIFLIIILLYYSGVVSAQMEYNNWIVQPGIQLRFLPEFKIIINTPDSPPFRSECISTISDPVNGNLLFYQGVEYDKILESNNLLAREYVLNPINSIVKNKEYKKIQSQNLGLNYLLHGGYSTHQSFLALPSNYECGKYILISLVGYTDHIKLTDYYGTLAYNRLDMKRSKGNGEILRPLNNLFYKNYLSEGLAGTIHANGKDYWVISSINWGSTPFVAIPIINDVPDTTQIKFSSESYGGDVGTSIMISPNSKFLYASRSNDRQCRVYNFDNQSGAITPYLYLDTLRDDKNIQLSKYLPEYIGGEFSYNNHYLYIIIRNNLLSVNDQQNNIVQIDLQSKTYKLFTIPFDENERFVVYTTFIYLAPDKNIYFATSTKDNSEVNIWRIASTDSKSPHFKKIRAMYKSELQGEAKAFGFPNVLSNVNFSHHVFDPNYKRVPTLCDLPKMLPFDTSICVGEWLSLSPKFESLPTMKLWQWDAKNAEVKTGKDSLFTTRFLSTGVFPVRFIGCNANGCDTNSIQVTVYEKPTILRSPDYTLCPGESVRIGRMNTPVFEYSWSPPDYLDNPNSATPLCTPQKNMQYILTVKNTNGCINYDTVNITLGGELSIFAGADTTICKDETLQLSASGAENFSWSPTTGLSDPTIANPLFTGTSTTQYIVTGRSGNCEGKDTIIITVNEKPTLSVSENREICAGDTVHLSASGASEYVWSPAEGLNNPTIANPIFSGIKTIEYTVTGKNGTCSDSKKVLITVNNKPILSVSENREICAGDTVHLSANGASEYSWSPAEGLNNPTIANPIFNGTKTTEYTVTGTIGNCADTKKVIVTVNNKPILSVSENREICLGDTVHLSASGADNYVWTPSTHLNNPFIPNPIAQPTENITYTVRGTNNNGCFEEKVISIILKNEEEKIISLDISDTIRYAPGTFVPVKIRIPAGISHATMSINYDPCCVKCDSTFSPNNDISTVSLDKKSIRFYVISPNKQEREITVPCMIYLPPDGRQTEKFTLSDIIHNEQCLIVRGNEDEILYDPSCAWQFRGVQSTGRFGIESDGTNARLYTGYGGNISLKIYDITGIEVWNYSSYYQSTDIQEIQLPTLSNGLYIIQASNGVWHDECVMMK